jgi:hypothetical protein
MFDDGWNMQNDFQSQSRCRRIDQEATVKEDGLAALGMYATQPFDHMT